MITHKTGDIFTTELNAIGHGVNTHGVMGSGIAVAVREKYPDVYAVYRRVCLRGELSGGDLLVVQSEVDGKHIFNLASQEKPGGNAKYSFLRESVNNSLVYCTENKIPALALPRIGSGIGKLEWDKALAIIEEESSLFPAVDLELWTYPDPPKNYWKK